MNTNYGKASSNSQKKSPLNNFDFDLGLGSGKPRSLNEQKGQTSSYSSFSSSQPKPSWQPNTPSWTHQPRPAPATGPGLNSRPTSMAGDISGKSWWATGSSGSSSNIGIIDKNPNLFGDLVGSVLGQGKGNNSNVPLKNAAPASNKSAYSMGNLADSLPKTSSTAKSGGSWGSSESFGSYKSAYSTSGSAVNGNKAPNLGGPSMKSMAGGNPGVGAVNSGKDPFDNLLNLGSKQPATLNSSTKGGHSQSNQGDDVFGDFQNASKSAKSAFPSSGNAMSSDSFMGSNMSSNSTADDFGFPMKNTASQKSPSQNSGFDPLDNLFGSSSTSNAGAASASEGFGGQQPSEVDDWGLDAEFGGSAGNDVGGTTELEGLPPPPGGVSASSAKNKGMENHKQGQYADAIKWLSWAVILLEKSGDSASTMDVLSCRASCYKEVGEYKKAVADCTKVLENDDKNVSVLVQRALLYESMEKYKLGADDLRTVLKIDPTNRIARSTIHRLNKMAE